MTILALAKGGALGVSENAIKREVTFANTVDFSVAANNMLSTDTAELIKIPAKFWMHTFGVRLDVAEGGTATAVFGDGTNPDGWLFTAFDLNGAVNTFAQSGLVLGEGTPNVFVDLFHPGKYYPAADTIDIDPAHDLDACKITVFAKGYLLH